MQAARQLAASSVIVPKFTKTTKPSCLPRRRLNARVLAPPVCVVAPPSIPSPASLEKLLPDEPSTSGEDPWTDARWKTMKWTVYRGVAYDLTSFMARHPGGSWLLNLAIGRDCTALFESYHLRPEVAVAHLRRLPVLMDFPVAAVPRSPYPNDSPVYVAIRERVRKEVFKGQDANGAHRVGSEGAAVAVLSFAAAAYGLYSWECNPLTGFILGLAGAWIGLTIQHCGNHGAMSRDATVNKLMGLTNDLIGGSSLMWRYHHQVSHHVHCNDDVFDQDVFSAFPLLRFDARLPRQWFHQWQHIYMWLTFPLLQVVFQIGDWKGILDNRTAGATLYGATTFERSTLVIGKLVHYTLLFAIPWALHGPSAMLGGAAAYIFSQSIVLASTFAVSHNVSEAKPDAVGQTQDAMYGELVDRDWGVQQILTSADWGGVVGNFFTGGLNLQIEHHLFPAVSFMHYPAIAKIVEQEARKRGIQYAHYPTLPQIIGRFSAYMRQVGLQDQVPASSRTAGALNAAAKL